MKHWRLSDTLGRSSWQVGKNSSFPLVPFFPPQETTRFLQRDGTEDGWPANDSPVSAAGALSSREAGRQWLGDVCSGGQQGYTEKQKQCRCIHTFLFLIWIIHTLAFCNASCRGKPSAYGSWMTSITWKCLSLCSCSAMLIKSTGRRNSARSSASSTPTPWSRKMDMTGWVDAGFSVKVTIAWRHPRKTILLKYVFLTIYNKRKKIGDWGKNNLFYFYVEFTVIVNLSYVCKSTFLIINVHHRLDAHSGINAMWLNN